MLAHFDKNEVEKVIENESIIFAQIPFLRRGYYDFRHEAGHLLTLEVDESKVVDSIYYYEGFYPFYRHKDLDTFKKLVEGSN